MDGYNNRECDGFRNFVHPGERIDDLQRDGLHIIQNPDWFCFGMDAVLLSAFANVKEGDRCLDLCTGNGVIPLLLSARTDGECFDGLEIQADIAEMADRSVSLNHLEDKIKIYTGDVKSAAQMLGTASYDVVTANPPYLSEDGGLINPGDHKAVARHEILCTLKDVIEASRDVLVSGGHMYMVHRPFRLAEMLHEMIMAGVEPKRMRMVYPYVDRDPTMVLIEGVRGGRSGMVVMKPLMIYEDEGVYTEEVRALYEDK